MGRNIFSKITEKGTMAKFVEKMDATTDIWIPYTQNIPSDAPSEKHTWLGNLPEPRVLLDGAQFDGIYEYNYDVENEEYSLLLSIDRNSFEDDRHGEWQSKISEMAETWAQFKNKLFAALLENGATTGFNSFDGVTYFNDTHVIGASNPDNNLTRSIVDQTIPTEAEARNIIHDCVFALRTMPDDHGRTTYNSTAAQRPGLRFIVHPEYEKFFSEVLHSELISTGGSNPFFNNLAVLDVLAQDGVGEGVEAAYCEA